MRIFMLKEAVKAIKFYRQLKSSKTNFTKTKPEDANNQEGSNQDST